MGYVRANQKTSGLAVQFAKESAGTPGTPDTYAGIGCLMDTWTITDTMGTTTTADGFSLCDSISAALAKTALGDREVSVSLNRKLVLGDATEAVILEVYKAQGSVNGYLKITLTDETAANTAVYEYEGYTTINTKTGNIDKGLAAKPATAVFEFKVNRIISEP